MSFHLSCHITCEHARSKSDWLIIVKWCPRNRGMYEKENRGGGKKEEKKNGTCIYIYI